MPSLQAARAGACDASVVVGDCVHAVQVDDRQRLAAVDKSAAHLIVGGGGGGGSSQALQQLRALAESLPSPPAAAVASAAIMDDLD